MTYYPLSSLMLAGIPKILIITTPHEQPFKIFLARAESGGLQIDYAVQMRPAAACES